MTRTILAAALSLSLCAHAADYNLGWDYPTGTAVKGFDLGCGSTPGTYTRLITNAPVVGNTYKITAIVEGADTFCSVRGFDAAAVRTLWSNEIILHPPLPAPTNLRAAIITALQQLKDIERALLMALGTEATADQDGR